MHEKKPKPSPRSNRVKKNSAGASNAMGFAWPISPRALVLGVITVVAAAALITAGQLEKAPETTAATTSRPDGSRQTPAVRSVKAPAAHSTAPAVAPAPKAAGAESTAKPEVKNAAPVTITGCLELDKDTFWLKDTSGVEVPKSRSWKSGFLKKKPSSIEVLDPKNRLKLRNFVGARVAATGVVTDSEMQAQSLRRVAASCK